MQMDISFRLFTMSVCQNDCIYLYNLNTYFWKTNTLHSFPLSNLREQYKIA